MPSQAILIRGSAIADSLVAPTLFRPEFSPILDPERTLSLGSLTFPYEQEVGAIIVAAIGGFIAGVALIFPMRQKDVALFGRGMKCS